MFCSHCDWRSFRNQRWGAVFQRQSVFKAVLRESWLLGATLTSEGESLCVWIKKKQSPGDPVGVGCSHRGANERKVAKEALDCAGCLLGWLAGYWSHSMRHKAITQAHRWKLSLLWQGHWEDRKASGGHRHPPMRLYLMEQSSLDRSQGCCFSGYFCYYSIYLRIYVIP